MRISFFLNLLFCHLFLLTSQGLLCQNGYYTAYEEALRNPANVETLDLSREEVGDELYQFKELRTLILWEGSLDSITEEVATLTHLEVITIASSELKYVSPQLFLLPNLRSVNLSGNLLTDVTFISNHSIEFLNLSYNDLAEVDSIHFLEKLEILNVSGNNLEAFSPRETFWEELEALDVSNNSITRIGASVGAAKNIQSVNLRNNQLSSFPKELQALPNMEILDLAGNRISHIPDNWLGATSLHKLDISGNPITCHKTVSFNQLRSLIRRKCLCSDCVFISQHPDFRVDPDNP